VATRAKDLKRRDRKEKAAENAEKALCLFFSSLGPSLVFFASVAVESFSGEKNE
jgi:hypothetical protein